MANLVQLKDVRVEFRGRQILEGVSLSVESGKVYGLVGANGSGKSVLLKVICGLLRPSGGEVSFDKTLLQKGRVFPSDFGVMIDGPGYMPFSSGFSNLWDLAQINRKIGREQVEKAMRIWGLDPGSRKAVRRYSLGMKQKLGLAQALMESPRVLVLDEPFNALDQRSSESLQQILRASAESGVTVIFTSHNRADIDDLAERVYAIENETVVLEGR